MRLICCSGSVRSNAPEDARGRLCDPMCHIALLRLRITGARLLPAPALMRLWFRCGDRWMALAELQQATRSEGEGTACMDRPPSSAPSKYEPPSASITETDGDGLEAPEGFSYVD